MTGLRARRIRRGLATVGESQVWTRRTTASSGVFSKYEQFAQLLLVHVWYVNDPGQACAYALRYDEAKSVADEMGWTTTQSWLGGRYETTRPSQRLQKLLQPYRMKAGDWRRKVQEAGTAKNL
jgi:hypothetical protein